MSEKSINIHSIWVEGDGKRRSKTLRDCFQSHPNLPLRGLYWLSKDLVENDKDDVVLGETMEPDAYKLRSIRNHLEHKYLKLHADSWSNVDRSDNAMFNDQWAVHLTVDELQKKTTRMLRLARSGIMYLSLAVHREESLRWSQAENVVTIPMVLPRWWHHK